MAQRSLVPDPASQSPDSDESRCRGTAGICPSREDPAPDVGQISGSVGPKVAAFLADPSCGLRAHFVHELAHSTYSPEQSSFRSDHAFAQIRSTSVRLWSSLVEFCPDFATTSVDATMLLNIGPNLAEHRCTSSKFANSSQLWSAFGPLAGFRPIVVEIRNACSTTVGARALVIFVCPNSAEGGPILVDIGPFLVDFGATLVELGPNW